MFQTTHYYDLTLNKIKVMKKFILFLIFLFSIGFIEGQTTFFKTISRYNEASHYIEQTTDGGYIIAGMNWTPSGVFGYAVKTNAVGDTIWTKIYGTVAEFYSGKQTADGGYIFLGKMRNSSTADQDIFVVKTDQLGNTQWQKTIASMSGIEGECIKQTSDLGYIIAGHGFGIGIGSEMYLIKLDSTGNLSWNYAIGAPNHERAYDVEETNDGGFVLIGETFNMSTGSLIYLLKLNGSGILQWSKSYGGSGFELGRNVIQTSDDGYLVLGNRRDTIIDSDDMCIIKTDSLGNVLWSNTYRGALGFAVESIKETTSGNFIISSATFDSTAFETNMLFTLITPTGSEIWSRFMGDPSGMTLWSYGSYAQQTNDGGYIFTGYSSTPGPGGFIYFIKADATGNSGCDSATSLVINPYTPIVSAPATSVLTGLIISPCIIPSSSLSDTILTYCTSVGINELQSTQQINVYPNPSSGQFNFSGLEKENKIEVFDMAGKIIYQSIATSDFETINISEKAKGIYFYRITKEMRLVQSGKICVQ